MSEPLKIVFKIHLGSSITEEREVIVRGRGGEVDSAITSARRDFRNSLLDNGVETKDAWYPGSRITHITHKVVYPKSKPEEEKAE